MCIYKEKSEKYSLEELFLYICVYFYICVTLQETSSIKIPRLSFNSTLFFDTSRSIFKHIIYNNNSKNTPNNLPQIQNFISSISYHSINPRAIEFKFFLPPYYELLHELVYFLRFAPSILKLPGNNGRKLRKNFSACPLDEAPLPTLWKRIIVKGSTSVNSWGCTCKLSTTCLTWS